jgi:hypothetical protein
MLDKKAAKREAKERVTAKGIYALRCTTSGEAWIGNAKDLKSAETGLLFALRSGGHINHGMQAAWKQHGADAFRFEVLEEFDPELPEMNLRDELRNRQKWWRNELNAGAI